METYDRRTVLAGVGGLGAALIAGCSSGGGGDGDGDGGDGDGDGSDGDGDGNATTTRAVLSRVQRTASVPADDFKQFSMNPSNSGTFEMEFSVTSGPAVDVYLMRVQQISYFQNAPGVDFEYITEGSVLDASTGSASTDLTSGQYFVVVDNSERGEAAPGEDGAAAEVELSATITA